jgi:hypothetical protein
MDALALGRPHAILDVGPTADAAGEGAFVVVKGLGGGKLACVARVGIHIMLYFFTGLELSLWGRVTAAEARESSMPREMAGLPAVAKAMTHAKKASLNMPSSRI